MLHVRFEGRSYNIPEDAVRLNPNVTDQQVLDRLARHFDLPREKFRHYVVDRRPSAIVVRPEAVYG